MAERVGDLLTRATMAVAHRPKSPASPVVDWTHRRVSSTEASLGGLQLDLLGKVPEHKFFDCGHLVSEIRADDYTETRSNSNRAGRPNDRKTTTF
jgi:hypothetical protein